MSAASPGILNLEAPSERTTAPGTQARGGNRNARGRGRGRNAANRGSTASGQPEPFRGGRRGRGGSRFTHSNITDGDRLAPSAEPAPSTGNHRGRRGPQNGATFEPASAEAGPSTTPRRRQFRSMLTTSDSTPKNVTQPDPLAPIPASTDLTTRLTAALRTPPYPDCPICFSSLTPPQPTWSCVPSVETQVCCYATFHLKCIRAWAEKSTKETRDAYRARNEDKEGEWHCPGCRSERYLVPRIYECFCGAVTDPKPGRLGTPHSCGNSCSRRRATCEHPCSLNCHPGPCPPCVTIIKQQCYCHKTISTFRCSHLRNADSVASLSCHGTCDRYLSCSKHRCTQKCHPGECVPCQRVEQVACYCGRETRDVACGHGMAKVCSYLNKTWEGRFSCESTCLRPYSCQLHMCQENCHQHSPDLSICPFDPSVINTCPCGKKLVELLAVPRTQCVDPIPTCGSICSKSLEGCNHVCSSPCHSGPCPPCAIQISLPCRCGDTIRYVACSVRQKPAPGEGNEEILCTKVCQGIRNCGRHACKRVCCPLASIRSKPPRGKRKADPLLDLEMDQSPWHACDLVCDKLLSCGLHRCTENDHKGRCPPCLQSSFEELFCRCTRTVLMPPVTCGTRIQCNYPCDRPAPACGHPKTPHNCHEYGDCPPCPFLTNKPCSCNKMVISNVRCSQEKVSCGTPCGKGLACGFHSCEKLCHGDDCPPCSSVCGKDRKLCLPAHHGCPLPCHAPGACPEVEPCQTIMTIRCPCGRLQQPAKCGRCTTSPNGRDAQGLKCIQDCLIAQRNARLADALGITPGKEKPSNVFYSTELLAFCRLNLPFCTTLEKTFDEFLKTDKKAHVLPHMPENRRRFVQELAKVYRLDTQAIDEEPRRSVELIRRVDSRIPTPLLSASLTPVNNLGKLADLRAPPRPAPAPTPPPSGRRGWASVLTQRPPASNASQSALPQSSIAQTPVSSITQARATSPIRSDWEADDDQE